MVLSLPVFFIGMARMAHSGALWPTTTKLTIDVHLWCELVKDDRRHLSSFKAP